MKHWDPHKFGTYNENILKLKTLNKKTIVSALKTIKPHSVWADATWFCLLYNSLAFHIKGGEYRNSIPKIPFYSLSSYSHIEIICNVYLKPLEISLSKYDRFKIDSYNYYNSFSFFPIKRIPEFICDVNKYYKLIKFS